MKKLIFFIFLYTSLNLFAQRTISGKVVTDDDVPLTSVLVINMANLSKSYTSSGGSFQVTAQDGDELRFVKEGYYRSFIKINPSTQELFVNLVQAAKEIEEVKIQKLTGDLNRDSKQLSKIDKTEQLQKEIGVPAPPEKPREKPADVKKDVLAPLLAARVNVQAIYDVVSGDARKMKSLYKYEDLQSDISRIKDATGDEYYIERGVPQNRITEFIGFCFTQNPKIRKFVQTRNSSGAMFEMETVFPVFINRLKH